MRFFIVGFSIGILLNLGCSPVQPPSTEDAQAGDSSNADGGALDILSQDTDIAVLPDTEPGDTQPDIGPDVPDGMDTEPPPDITPPPSCADGNKCTIEYWDEEVGECVFFPVNCDDGIPCTEDNCYPETGCEFVYQRLSGCCLEDAECDDGNPCTLNVCEKKMCQTIIDPSIGCCQVDSDCEDSDPCALWTCIDNQCEATFLSPPECCYQDGDCPIVSPCSLPACHLGICTQTSSCCQSVDDCDSLNDCADPQCIDGWCIPKSNGEDGCCDSESPLLFMDFENSTSQGLTLLNSDPEVGWQITSEAPVDSAYALYYGSSQSWTYSGEQAHAGTVTTAILSLPPATATVLSFRVLAEIQPEPLLDRLLLRAIHETGDTTVLWDKSELTQSGWQEISMTLAAFAGQDLQLQWEFDTITADANFFFGVLLDDLLVSTSCEPFNCTQDEDCNDGISATTDACVEDDCAYLIAPNYCEISPAACNDNNPCTHDLCVDQNCVYEPVEGCCQFKSQCDDENPCTTDLCEPLSGCVFTGIYGCCTEDTDCEDGDPCTEDLCGDNGCEYANISACCDHNEDCFDGNECTSDLCVDASCLHLTLCCEVLSDCPNEDPLCAIPTCEENACHWTYVDQEGCCKDTVWSESFDGPSPLTTWTLVTDNDLEDGVGWQPVTGMLSTSSPGALYYGNPNTLSYATGETGNIAEIATPPIQLPTSGHIELAFQLYLANEYAAGVYPNPDWDRLTVWLYPSQGMPQILWDSGWGEPVWWSVNDEGEPVAATWVEIDQLMLSNHADQFIQLGFRFDTKDESNNDHFGVIIDDIQITTTCYP